MKKLFLLLITISGLCLHGQKVLISPDAATYNTNHPADNANFTIDGNITSRGLIYAGGGSTNLGDPGKNGQVLVSQGQNLPPKWRTLNIPTIEPGSFYLIYNNAFSDYKQTTQGLANINTVTGSNGPYNLGTLRSALTDFTTIAGLTKTFDVFSTQNQVYITFEAMAQIEGTANNGYGVDFVCGIFVGENGKPGTRDLRGIRKATINIGANANAFATFTQIALADGLGVGKYEVEVACKRTANYSSFNGALSVGNKAGNTSNLGAFASQTSLKVEVYEIPTVFNDILGNPVP